MLLNQQMRLSGLTSPPAPATLFDAERVDRKLARVWRKNKIVGNHPALCPGRSVMVNQKDGETFMRVRS
jgi:hypothetical protein